MWRAVVGAVCGVIGLALVASAGVAPATAATEANVRVAEYVRVSDSGGAPDVDSNVAVTVTVADSGYGVTPR
jgi:hypothetical protein